MKGITLNVSEELLRKMRRHPDVDWSSFVCAIVASKIRDLEAMDRTATKSKLRAQDVAELDYLFKHSLLMRHSRRARRKGGGPTPPRQE